jgi:hypothetical protein
MKILLKVCNKVIISIGLVAFSSSMLSAQACPPKKEVTQNVENIASGFISLSFSIKDEDTKKLILDTFKIHITMPNYSLIIKRVTSGVAIFQIPIEMMEDTITILISDNKRYLPKYLTLQNPKSIPSAHLKSQEKAQKEMEKRYRKRMRRFKRKWWQKKSENRVWNLKGCPDF